MVNKPFGWRSKSRRNRKRTNNLIWQSASEPHHFLILLPKNKVWGKRTFHFLRVSKEPTQIGIEMRFRHSQHLPWLGTDYHPTCDTLNPLAEAIVEPVIQYLKARSAGKIQAVARFHELIFRLYDRIVSEVALFVTPESILQHQGKRDIDYSALENMLDAFDRETFRT